MSSSPRDCYINGDGKDDAGLLNLDVEQFYDMTSLPPSLSVTINQPAGNEESDANTEIEMRKTIMVGGDYQASIPELIGTIDKTTRLPYAEKDKLLWSPYALTDDAIEDYLVKAHQINFSKATGVAAIPRGLHTRDDEQALYVLLQNAFDVDEASEKLQSADVSSTNNQPPPPPLWTEEECRNFESGIRVFGKDFFLIHLYKVKNRSVGDLVQFYYLWKKTERFDSFVNRTKTDKRRCSVSSGGTCDQRDNVSPLTDLQFTDIPNCMYEDAQVKEANDDDSVIENLFMQKLDKKNTVLEGVDSVFDIYNQQVASAEQQPYNDA